MVGRDSSLYLVHAREGAIPSHHQFRRNQPVLRICSIILAKRSAGGMSSSCRITAIKDLCLCLGGSRHSARLNETHESFINCIIDTQSAERDATRFTVVEQAPPARVSWDVMLGAGISNRELPAAASATDKSDKQRVAVLRRAQLM
jgi:hypothetical protein